MFSFLVSLPISDPILYSISVTLSVYLFESQKHARPDDSPSVDSPSPATN
jgi:hypothetical protein